MPPKSVSERQQDLRAKRAMLGMTEVRGIYLPPELHKALKDHARKLLAQPPASARPERKSC